MIDDNSGRPTNNPLIQDVGEFKYLKIYLISNTEFIYLKNIVNVYYYYILLFGLGELGLKFNASSI